MKETSDEKNKVIIDLLSYDDRDLDEALVTILRAIIQRISDLETRYKEVISMLEDQNEFNKSVEEFILSTRKINQE